MFHVPYLVLLEMGQTKRKTRLNKPLWSINNHDVNLKYLCQFLRVQVYDLDPTARVF